MGCLMMTKYEHIPKAMINPLSWYRCQKKEVHCGLPPISGQWRQDTKHTYKLVELDEDQLEILSYFCMTCCCFLSLTVCDNRCKGTFINKLYFKKHSTFPTTQFLGPEILSARNWHYGSVLGSQQLTECTLSFMGNTNLR